MVVVVFFCLPERNARGDTYEHALGQATEALRGSAVGMADHRHPMPPARTIPDMVAAADTDRYAVTGQIPVTIPVPPVNVLAA